MRLVLDESALIAALRSPAGAPAENPRLVRRKKVRPWRARPSLGDGPGMAPRCRLARADIAGSETH
jgi:hypothetical protein